VTGGFHLLHAEEESIRRLFASMKSRGIKRLHPLHCSGSVAQTIAREMFGDHSKPPRAGDVFIP
jgi:metal-dependent hydrolase (beta-lactamase superfamily II)